MEILLERGHERKCKISVEPLLDYVWIYHYCSTWRNAQRSS